IQVASLPAITSSPRGLVSSSAITSWARRRRSSICSAYSAKILPAVVSEIRLPNRSNRSARFGSRISLTTAAKPFEQVRTQFLFQLPHLRADGRLRPVTGLGGFRETLQPDDLQERVELIEIHNLPNPPKRPGPRFSASQAPCHAARGSVKFQIGGIEKIDFPCAGAFGKYYNKGSGWCGPDNGMGKNAFVWGS